MQSSFLGKRAQALFVVGAIAAALTGPALVAQADTKPPSAATPTTVSTDVLPTAQIDGVAWKQLVVGNTVYVGGQFTTARPAGAAPGAQTVARSNFLAYDLTTGALLPFAPAFNSQVRSLAVSPDQQTLYVGGQFTTVSGVNRYRIAAFDIATGALKTSFAAGTNATVYGIAATATTVYLAGSFTSINSQTRNNAAAVTAGSGALLPFAVTPAGGTIQHVVVSPDGAKVVLGGNFTSMNGSNSPGYGLALVNATTGASQALQANTVIRNAGANSAITSLTVAPEGFYGSGYRFGSTSGNLEGTFKADWSGTLIWVGDCHGDSYSVAAASDQVYVAGHPHDCSNIGSFPDTEDPVNYHHGIALTAARTGSVTKRVTDYYDFRGQPAPSVLNWHPDFTVGTYTGQSQGPWSVAIGGDYVVYGGEFTKVNGKGQQGLVRFARPASAPNLDGPRASGTGFNLSGSSAFLSRKNVLRWQANWDRDNTRLVYKLTRDGATINQPTQDSTFWTRPTLTFTDTGVTRGRTYSYVVTATDPFGNTTTSSAVSVTTR
ncbi:MAG TPA: hypothetical protein VIT20_02985 [Propionibacteriaceae bacterium]